MAWSAVGAVLRASAGPAVATVVVAVTRTAQTPMLMFWTRVGRGVWFMSDPFRWAFSVSLTRLRAGVEKRPANRPTADLQNVLDPRSGTT